MTDARKRCEPTPPVRSGLQTTRSGRPTLHLSAVGREASDQRSALLGGLFREGARVLVLCADGGRLGLKRDPSPGGLPAHDILNIGLTHHPGHIDAAMEFY